MEIQDKIVYSQEDILRRIDNVLDQMKIFRYDIRFRQLGDSFIDKFNEWESNIRKQRDNPFTLVVVGEFKRGKSTLINAFLKEKLLPTDVRTETVTLNRVSYGLPANEAVLVDGGRAKLSDGEIKREKLEEVLKSIKQPVTHLEIRRPYEYLKRITIIDTPGLDDASTDFSVQVSEAILQADAILYLFNSQYPISLTEQLFLRSSVLPSQFSDLFLVGNFADTFDSVEAVEAMRSTTEKRLKGILPKAKVYMVSALDEVSRVLNLPRPMPEMADFLKKEFSLLYQDVDALVEKKHATCVCDRVERLTLAMISELEEEIESVKQGLSMDKEKRDITLREIEDVKIREIKNHNMVLKKIADAIIAMEMDAKLWINKFLERILDETKNLENEDSNVLRKYYEFYCVDLLDLALNECIDYHREKIYDLLNEAHIGTSEKLAKNLSIRYENQLRFKLDNRAWTKGDNISLVVSCLQGGSASRSFLGTVASLAVDGITGYLRERETNEKAANIVNEIRTKMDGLSDSLDRTISELYRTLMEKTEKIVNDYYEDKIAAQERLVQRAVIVSEKALSDKEELNSVLQEAISVLKKGESVVRMSLP